jgi:hypothetical protein
VTGTQVALCYFVAAPLLVGVMELMFAHISRQRKAEIRRMNTPEVRARLFRQAWTEQMKGSREFYDRDKDGI